MELHDGLREKPIFRSSPQGRGQAALLGCYTAQNKGRDQFSTPFYISHRDKYRKLPVIFQTFAIGLTSELGFSTNTSPLSQTDTQGEKTAPIFRHQTSET